MRGNILDKVLSRYPSKAWLYYEKRAEYLDSIEEQRLRGVLKAAIPVDGWNEDLTLPLVVIRESDPQVCDDHSSEVSAVVGDYDSLTSSASSDSLSTATSACSSPSPASTVLYLDPLPREPPLAFRAQPPPAKMTIEKKLECIARWTLFTIDGRPYLATSVRKDFNEDWVGSGAEEDELVSWVKSMWWQIWLRQARVNYVGMWKQRFVKEEKTKMQKMGGLQERKVAVAWWKLHKGGDMGFMV